MPLLVQKVVLRTSLVVRGLRFRAPDAEGRGFIPGQGTRSHRLQLSLHATAEDPTCCGEDLGQPNK